MLFKTGPAGKLVLMKIAEDISENMVAFRIIACMK